MTKSYNRNDTAFLASRRKTGADLQAAQKLSVIDGAEFLRRVTAFIEQVKAEGKSRSVPPYYAQMARYGCRFFVTHNRCCGADTESYGAAWCPEHRARVFLPKSVAKELVKIP